MEHNDIDFRKAVRLIEEARDRLDEASEILGAFNTGDMSGRNTIADKAWSIDRNIADIRAIAKHMGAEMTDRLIAIDLDNTFADYTTAFADCLAQMGRPVRGGDPTTYDFGCDGWFGEGNGDVFPEFHSRAVMLGLYLRERPYLHARRAVDTLTFDHPAWHVAFVTSRRDDGDDTARWMLGLGIDMSLEFDYANQCLDHMDPTGMELGRAVSERARSGRWSMGLLSEPNGVGWCHLPDKESLEADLYIEDDPAMLDRLIDLGLPVLVRRHAYNTAQCERAMRSDVRGAVFDDWTQVPGLAERLIGGSH